MNILIISSYIFGYIDHLKPAFEAKGIEVEFIYHGKDPLDFKYKSTAHHITAFLKKAVGHNTKMEFRHEALSHHLKGKNYDQILIIHPQYLAPKTHVFLKSITNRYITFLFDSMAKMPRQEPVLSYFDQVYSYEKKDCENFGFEFLTNFIPVTEFVTEFLKPETDFFNISSLDERYPTLLRIAKYLKNNEFKYNFLVFTKKKETSVFVDIIDRKLEIQEVHNKIANSRVLVDIQREDQQGLSFRVLESLGYQKKLITTNADVINYDFYNPKNILVIDPESIKIPQTFLQTVYEEVPQNILYGYTPKSWVETVFNL